jgi:hypothetical protein
MTRKLYDPLDLDTQPERKKAKKRDRSGSVEFNRYWLPREVYESTRVVKQPPVLPAFVKPLKPVCKP